MPPAWPSNEAQSCIYITNTAIIAITFRSLLLQTGTSQFGLTGSTLSTGYGICINHKVYLNEARGQLCRKAVMSIVLPHWWPIGFTSPFSQQVTITVAPRM